MRAALATQARLTLMYVGLALIFAGQAAAADHSTTTVQFTQKDTQHVTGL